MANMATDTRYINLTLEIGGEAIRIQPGSPYRLMGIEGIESGEYAVDLGRNAYLDGGYLQSERVEPRSINILFEVALWERTETLRQELISFFRPKTDGVLTVSRAGVTRSIGFRLASCRFLQENIYHHLRVEADLICPDPYFSDPAESAERFLRIEPLFSAPFSTYQNAGATAGLFVRSDTVTLENKGHADIGVVVEMLAEHGGISRPSVAFGGEYVRFLRDVPENSTLEISTVKGQKSVRLDGAPANFYDRTSVFFQLPPGRHVISISAESGREFANTAVRYRLKYLGL